MCPWHILGLVQRANAANVLDNGDKMGGTHSTHLMHLAFGCSKVYKNLIQLCHLVNLISITYTKYSDKFIGQVFDMPGKPSTT
jgi:hypothetical protein